jgi:ribosomal protein S18 acetylase RimI-like enzyme
MIKVRKATAGDSDIIAMYFLLAMEEIVYSFIGRKDRNEARKFMSHFVKEENNQYSYQNCWVALNDTGVVAAVNVYDGAQLAKLRQPVIEYIRSSFNKEVEPEDETQAGEYYIDSLGVNANQQGKGIGSQLLRFLIDEYVYRRNQTLGLLVDEANPRAKRLYLKLGFKSAGRKIIFGKTLDHLQIRA